MRQNFNEVKDVFRDNKRETQEEDDEAVGEIMATIPMFSECIHQDDTSYFENEISDYIQATTGGVSRVIYATNSTSKLIKLKNPFKIQ